MWEPITTGRSGAKVSRGASAVRKESSDPAVDLVGEGERLRWLREVGIPAPQVLECRPGLLITVEVAGRTGAEPWPAGQRPAVVDALADLAARLHALPVTGCPFDRRLAVTIPQALAAGVDLDDLDPQRWGWSRDRLTARLLDTLPSVEDLVVCHGDLTPPNVLLDPVPCEITGVVDAGRLGVADRWLDLAVMTRSLDNSQQFGGWAARRFLQRYGAKPDPEKIEFYRLLDEFF